MVNGNFIGMNFYPNSFRSEVTKDKQLIKLPVYWNQLDSIKLPAHGYATYRLKVTMDDPEEDFAINLPLVQGAYKIWIDGELVGNVGEIGKNSTISKSFLKNTYVHFNKPNDEFYIVIQTSNFTEIFGGIGPKIELGYMEDISKNRESEIIMGIFIFGLNIIMAIYHFVLYIFRRKDKSNLVLGIFGLAISLTAFSLQNYIYLILPDGIMWLFGSRFYNILSLIILPSFTIFVYEIFPEETNKYFIKVLTAICAISLFITIFIPRSYLYNILYIIIFVAVIDIIALLITITRAIIKKREGAIIISTGFIMVAISGINDILTNMGIINTPRLTAWGLSCVIISNSIIIAKKFSKSFYSVENFSEKLL